MVWNILLVLWVSYPGCAPPEAPCAPPALILRQRENLQSLTQSSALQQLTYLLSTFFPA